MYYHKITFLLLLCFTIFHSCKPTSETFIKPNIVLIVTDDQGWGDLGINGNPYINTPNIDRLAKDGIQFSRFYVSPVCSPTRAEILTARYHPRGGVYSTSQGGEMLDLDETTIAEVLKINGYSTAAYGKWHNGTQSPYHPNDRGFDEFYGFCSGHWGNYMSPMLDRNGKIVKGDGFIIDDLTSNALKFIKEKEDDPFFVYLAYNTPHSPMQVPDKWWDKYKDGPLDTTHRYASKQQIQKTRAAYALCENIDWNVGRVMDQLESINQLENTIIVYMSDNGPNGWRWNNNLKGTKGKTDEGGVRSPFIVSWKQKLKHKIIDRIAGAIDILPTITDLANITQTYEKPLDGISLKPLLFGSSESWSDRYIFSHWQGRVSVRNQKYILDHEDQLFDLESDLQQEYPLSESHIKSELLKEKKKWKESVLSELDFNRKELFPIGHEGSPTTQLPARDGQPHGNIKRSNRWPNSSYFTNWTTTSDSITWDCDILRSGDYQATVYYTCKEDDLGTSLILKQGRNVIKTPITQAHDPDFNGVELDRYPREESFEKDFKTFDMGNINLDVGEHRITLKSSELKGDEFIDFRLLVLEKTD